MPCAETRYRVLETPTGAFAVFVDETGAVGTCWYDDRAREHLAAARPDPALLPDLTGRLLRYFDGDQVDFDDVPTPADSPFQQQVLAACRRIPWGGRRTYGQLAADAGYDASRARAVGQVLRRNPLPVVIPCHRVVARDGSLHGFSGSSDPIGPELRIKRTLLEIESDEPGLFPTRLNPDSRTSEETSTAAATAAAPDAKGQR